MLPNLPIKFLNRSRKYLFIFSLTLLINANIHATNYYVNDTSTIGDIYTTSTGKDINEGRLPSSPKLSLLAAYKIALAGDVIYVDTGNYPQDDTIDSTIVNNPKKIQIIRAGSNIPVYKKKTLPSNQKVSPAIFYVDNDKPIERDVYMQQLQNTARKK